MTFSSEQIEEFRKFARAEFGRCGPVHIQISNHGMRAYREDRPDWPILSPDPPQVCTDCRRPLGQQHKPSCHRQGMVTTAFRLPEPMKPPADRLTEGDLIEIENTVLRDRQRLADSCEGFTENDRIVRTLTRLLELGRAALASESVSGSSAPSKPKGKGNKAL